MTATLEVLTDEERADAEAWLRAEINKPLVGPIPYPRWHSPRAKLARQLILMGDQSRLRARLGVVARLGVIESAYFCVEVNALIAEYERLSR